MSTVIVWDLETAIDIDGYARANGLFGQDEEEIRGAIGHGFMRPLYHSIVCIGAVIAEYFDGGWQVKAIGAPHVGESSEKEIIKRFVDKIDELRPQLVTYNGSSFDLPVLRFRAMSHELEAPGLLARPYFNRYSNDALDLCDALSSFGATTKLKLDEICKFMGFDGKPENIDGSKVDDYFRAGRIDEIAKYCMTDVVNTYRLFLRYSLFCGHINTEGFKLSEERLAAFIERQDQSNRCGG